MAGRGDDPRATVTRAASNPLVIAGLWALALLSCIHFIQLCSDVWTAGFLDFPIFLGHARRFLSTGVLYVEDLSKYYPGARIYKFPPLYAVLLLPVVRSAGQGLFFYHWLLQIAVYLTALALAISIFKPRAAPWFVPAALILGLNFTPFFETLARLQVEGPILLLLVLCVFFFKRGFGVLAGAALGIGVMLKIYPVFLLFYFGLRARWNVIAGCIGTMIAITLGTVWVLGAAENAKYFFEILPHISSELPRYSIESVSMTRYLMHLEGVGPQQAKQIAQLIFFALLAVTSLAVARNRKVEDQHKLFMLEFSAFVAVMLLGLSNAWLNYQLLLLLGIGYTLSHFADGLAFDRQGVALGTALFSACFLMLFSRDAEMLNFWFSYGVRESLMSLRFLSSLLIWGVLVVLMFSWPGAPPPNPTVVENEAI